MLRQGFAELLRNARLGQGKNTPRIIMCGSREDTYKKFMDGVARVRDAISMILVDSEMAVAPLQSAVAHLQFLDKWDLRCASPEQVHLMVQVMETWIVADGTALEKYYGRNFHSASLPNALDLETVSKQDIEKSLKKATEKTTKGGYHKIRDARALLAQVRPSEIRSRCPHCERFFASLESLG
jgi:hypothetical protein